MELVVHPADPTRNCAEMGAEHSMGEYIMYLRAEQEPQAFPHALLVPTLFSGWYYSHYALANGIWYALIVLGLISWGVSLVRKIAGRS